MKWPIEEKSPGNNLPKDPRKDSSLIICCRHRKWEASLQQCRFYECFLIPYHSSNPRGQKLAGQLGGRGERKEKWHKVERRNQPRILPLLGLCRLPAWGTPQPGEDVLFKIRWSFDKYLWARLSGHRLEIIFATKGCYLRVREKWWHLCTVPYRTGENYPHWMCTKFLKTP